VERCFYAVRSRRGRSGLRKTVSLDRESVVEEGRCKSSGYVYLCCAVEARQGKRSHLQGYEGAEPRSQVRAGG
jgi:hypothetical protein